MGLLSEPALFDNFFPHDNARYIEVVHDHCESQYHTYKSTEPVTWETCWPILECILDNWSEIDKALLGVTGLILGLTPTILSWLGAGALDMSLLSSQRPVLSMLLSVGSPVFSPVNLFTQWEPSVILDPRPLARKIPKIFQQHYILVSLCQYILGLGAVANVTHVAYLLSSKAVTLSSSCENRYFVFLWMYVAVVIPVVACLAFRARGTWFCSPSIAASKANKPLAELVLGLLNTETCPCICRDRKVLKWRGDTPMAILWTNFTTVLTIGHVVWGTVVLGSTTLVAPVDAVMLIGRFAASAVMCKALLTFELAGMRETVVLEYV